MKDSTNMTGYKCPCGLKSCEHCIDRPLKNGMRCAQQVRRIKAETPALCWGLLNKH